MAGLQGCLQPRLPRVAGLCVGLIATALILVVVELLRSSASVRVILVVVAILLVVQLPRLFFGLVMCTELIILVHA